MAGEASAETKPKVEGGGETISIKVKDQSGGEVVFRCAAAAAAAAFRAVRCSRPPSLLPTRLPPTCIDSVKPSTKFDRIFKAFADKKAQDANTVKFLYDGERVMGHQTPEELGMENDDVGAAPLRRLPPALRAAAARGAAAAASRRQCCAAAHPAARSLPLSLPPRRSASTRSSSRSAARADPARTAAAPAAHTTT
jgi:hypothetical protein